MCLHGLLLDLVSDLWHLDSHVALPDRDLFLASLAGRWLTLRAGGRISPLLSGRLRSRLLFSLSLSFGFSFDPFSFPDSLANFLSLLLELTLSKVHDPVDLLIYLLKYLRFVLPGITENCLDFLIGFVGLGDSLACIWD